MYFSDLQEQLDQLREQKDQYKAISVDLQKTVDEHSNVSINYKEIGKTTHDLQKTVDEHSNVYTNYKEIGKTIHA